MDSSSAGHPLQDALAALAASYRTDEDILDLLIRISAKSAAAAVQNME